ncbi:TonB-dependent receptor [Sediminibacterium sp.]|uniref:TonB-dependent receptor n=1 Tax=Sediminibacterium sp. TaxID=1917865 RepID=UPI003F71C7AE
MKDVVVTVFNSYVKWKELPAALAIVKKKDFLQYSPASVLPAINMVAGVRMEERSPGSYRLSVRGSLLRSPFGIRNVKVYWNEIPFSDATGNTYLNLINPASIDQIEIAKGPASSMYGAGTGGVFLMGQSASFSTGKKGAISLEFTGGSYGYNQQQLTINHSNKQFTSGLQLHRLASGGYRDHSALNRTGLFWQTQIIRAKHTVKTGLFYTRLNYQTPGGITSAQLLLNPRLSRQATATLPSAIEQNASIQNNTIWVGIQDHFQISQQMLIKSFFSINHTQFINPFITNYEARNEWNGSAGTQFIYAPLSNIESLKWITGIEWMVNKSTVKNFINNKGVAGNIFANDLIYAQQGFVFSQLSFKPIKQLLVNAGISINQQLYQYKSLITPNQLMNNRSIQSPFSPRLTLNYTLGKSLNLYGIIARGFSSPTLAEIRPSDGNFYPKLNAEQGWNLELGIKGSFLNNKILLDASFYSFQLKNAIVRRNDVNGNEYFINAGATDQTGFEAMLKYFVIPNAKGRKATLDLTNSFSFQPYRFTNYQQGGAVFNGNPITGVPKYILVSSLNWGHQNGWSFNITANLSSKVSLNDAATVYANGYQLVQAKLSKQVLWNKKTIQFYVGGDNLLNQSYSLGNDINAAGNRFFNPAANRNGYFGIRLSFQ